MHEGEPVEVYTAYVDDWVSGFEIAAVTSAGYRVRRQSDGSVLPTETDVRDVRPASPARRLVFAP